MMICLALYWVVAYNPRCGVLCVFGIGSCVYKAIGFPAPIVLLHDVHTVEDFTFLSPNPLCLCVSYVRLSVDVFL
jgi:hypothetical protein